MEYTITITAEAPYVLKLLAVIQPVFSGEHELALLLANRAFSLDIHVNEIRGMNREALIRRILIGEDKISCERAAGTSAPTEDGRALKERNEKSLDLHFVRVCVEKTQETVVMNFTLPSGRKISAEIHDESTTSEAYADLFDGDDLVCMMRFFNKYQGRNWMYPIVRRACNGLISKAGKKCRNRNNRRAKLNRIPNS